MVVTGERAVQGLVGLVGVAAGAYGALLLLDLDLPDLLDAGLWLALRRVLPARTWTAVTVGLVVLLTVTVTAVPVLGRFGARPDNPTLLDRDYPGGWLLLTLVVVAGTLVWALRARFRRTGGTAGPGHPPRSRPPR